MPTRTERMRGALLGMFIGDALAMPVHWYYNTAALDRDYPKLDGYLAPRRLHPDSLLAKSNTGGHGRGGSSGDIVGGVILKGRKHFWSQPQLHYHQGMAAGENTLNLRCVRLLLQSIASCGGYQADDWLARYIAFMTTRDSHNDTYAESFHRDFFARWASGKPPRECAGEQGHNTASIGGLVFVLPMVLACGAESPAVLEQLRLTHRSDRLEVYARGVAGLFEQLCAGADVRSAVARVAGPGIVASAERAAAEKLDDRSFVGGKVSSACYVDGAVPAVLYLLARYQRDARSALLANARCGGDNCHRGAVLGALLGALVGVQGLPQDLLTGLADHDSLRQEIDAFVITCGAAVR